MPWIILRNSDLKIFQINSLINLELAGEGQKASVYSSNHSVRSIKYKSIAKSTFLPAP